jgi:hypothetical protein
MNITEECSNPESSYVRKPSKEDIECKTYYKGQFAGCMFHAAGYLCPTPIESEECDEVRKYSFCMLEKTKKQQSADEVKDEKSTETKE